MHSDALKRHFRGTDVFATRDFLKVFAESPAKALRTPYIYECPLMKQLVYTTFTGY
jgi:hypothetical protein